MSYKEMSETGKAVCEYVELFYRQKWLQMQVCRLPDYTPKDLSMEIERRKQELPPDARIAVENYLAKPIASSMGSPIFKRLPWGEWLQKHLKENPGDYSKLQKFEITFGNQEILDSMEWGMEHK